MRALVRHSSRHLGETLVRPGCIFLTATLALLSLFRSGAKPSRGIHATTLLLFPAMIGLSQIAEAQNRVVIAVGTALDGKGKVFHDTRIVVSGSKIVPIDRKVSPIDCDLRGLTVMPGWIDAHVHITSSLGPDGKNAGMGADTPEAAYRTAANAYSTLLAGFTTKRTHNIYAMRCPLYRALHETIQLTSSFELAEPPTTL